MFTPTPASVAVLSVVPVAAAFAVVARRKRDHPAGVPVTVYWLFLAAGAATYGAELAALAPSTKTLLAGFGLACMSGFVGSWLATALAYTGNRDWMSRRVVAGLCVEPLVVVVVTVVPGLRDLLFDVPASGGPGSMSTIGAEAGLVTVGHFLYVLVLAAVATGLFLNLFVRSRHLYRVEATALLGAAVAPWLTIFVQTFGVIEGVDTSVFTWTLAGMAITVGLYRVRLLDPVPVGYSSVVENMGDGVLVLADDDRVGDTNPAAEHLFGVDAREIRGEPVTTVLDDWERVAGNDDGVAGNDEGGDDEGGDDEGGDGGEWTELPVSVDGERRYLEVQVSPFFDRFDRRIGRLVVVRDVTDRKRREQRLARYETVFETVRDRVYVLDAGGEFLLVNDPFAELLGRDGEQLVGEPFESILAPSAEQVTPTADGTTGEGTLELAIRTAGGETVPAETVFAPVEIGETEGVVGYVRDISRRKRAERDLAATTEQLRTIVDASPLAIVTSDTEGNVERWNPVAEEMFGYAESEVVGEPPPIIPDEERDRIRERFRRALDGERFRGVETTLERRDGSTVDASVSVAPLPGPSGESRGTVSIIADITDRKERERQLRRKNDRLDQFASIVSHDLRNPLTVADGRLELAREECDSDHLDHVADSLARMGTIIDDTLVLARGGRTVAEPETVSIAAVAEQCWDQVDTGDVHLEVEGTVRAEADPDRLQQVFENLFRNAVEHGSTGSRPEADHDGPDVTVTVGALDGDGFYVEDDGPGIPPDEREAVFRPGESGDPDGTGFGLAIVEQIVDAHGWEVEVTEGSDGGARFEITGLARPGSRGRDVT